MKEEVSCGTERVIYVKDKYPNYKYYMTLPIDEPSINPEELNSFWEKANINMVTNIFTFYSDFYCEEDLLSNNSCKIVMLEDMVLYTSRAVIPASKENKKIKYLSAYKRHIGVFFFSSMVLEYQYSSLWKHREENVMIEGLEQNAFVPWMNAYKIKHIGFGVDMEEDIKKLEERMNG